MRRITPEEYETNLRRMIPLFQGKFAGLVKTLTAAMRTAAVRKEFETAALVRDQIKALKTVAEKQSIVDMRKESYDVIGLATAEDTSVINVFRVRNGVLLDRASHPLRHPFASPPEELLQSFLEQYYAYGADVPRTIYVPLHAASPLPRQTSIIVPQRGKKRHLLRLSAENAEEELIRFTRLQLLKRSKTEEALATLQKRLSLPKLPVRIEAYDISNVQGRHAVGAMTVLMNGTPAPREYRSFTIKTIVGSNDVAMLQEIIHRRSAHNDWPLPNLILIDGGKPQLAAAQQALNEHNAHTPLIGIAKGRGLDTRRRRTRGEEIWSIDISGKYHLIDFSGEPTARLLLDRIRDEAHRFGITHYRKKHGKEIAATRLDDIPGIGPKTRKLLLQHYGSLEQIKKAPLSELGQLVGTHRAGLIKTNEPQQTETNES